MKLLTFYFLVISISAFAQDTTTSYLNKKWKKTKPDKAIYIQNEIRFKFNCTKIELFDTEGKLNLSGYYIDDYMDSTWCIYNKKGNRYDTLNYSGIKEIYINNKTKSPFEEIFFIVEEMPKFGNINNDSKEEFRKYVVENLHYPIRAQKNNTIGKVYISFVVGPDGMIYLTKAVAKIDKDLTFEALRVIRDSPKWIPGKQRNIEVPVMYTMPIQFIL